MWDDSPGQYNTMCLHQSMCTLCQLERQGLGPQYHLKQNKQNISAKNSAQSYLVTANSAQSYSVTANPQVKVLCTATAWCQSDVITQWCILAYIWSWQHLCLLFSQGCFSRPSKRRRTIAPHSSCGQILWWGGWWLVMIIASTYIHTHPYNSILYLHKYDYLLHKDFDLNIHNGCICVFTPVSLFSRFILGLKPAFGNKFGWFPLSGK